MIDSDEAFEVEDDEVFEVGWGVVVISVHCLNIITCFNVSYIF